MPFRIHLQFVLGASLLLVMAFTGPTPDLRMFSATVAAVMGVIYAWWITRCAARRLRSLQMELAQLKGAIRGRDEELLERTTELSNQKLEFEQLAQLAAREQEKLAILMESVPDAIVAVDRDLRIIEWNRGAELLTGCGRDEAMGRPAEERLLLLEQREGAEHQAPSLFRQALESRQPADSAPRDLLLARVDGSRLPVHATVTPILSRAPEGSGEATALVAIFRDISKQREIEALKEDFLATVTHDLATPLTVILGNARLLQIRRRQALSLEELQLVENIIHGGRNLNSLIKNLLNSAKLEAGRMLYQPEHFSLSRLLTETVEPFGPLAAQRGFSLRLRFPPSLVAYADREKLQEVINNLVGNAFKFTQKGGIIAVDAREEGDQVAIIVSDTGKGIPSDALPRLFQKFSQVKGERRGTGLGLYIVKKFVEDQGGTVAIESAPGKGTAFTVRLPRGDTARVEEEPPTEWGRVRSGTILVVEDDRDVAALIGLYLERDHHAVVTAHSAQEALLALRRAPPDAVTIDYQLPDMTGDELASLIRHDPTLPEIPLILVSGRENVEYVPRTILLFDRILGKPIRPDELRQAVQDLLVKETREEDALQNGSGPRAAPPG